MLEYNIDSDSDSDRMEVAVDNQIRSYQCQRMNRLDPLTYFHGVTWLRRLLLFEVGHLLSLEEDYSLKVGELDSLMDPTR